MNDLSISHDPHNFLTYHRTTQDKIRPRSGKPPPSDEGSKLHPTKDTGGHSIYVVKTLYTYDYRNQADDQVAFFESEKPRLPTVPKRKGIRLDPKENEIPIITKKVTIDTDTKPGVKLTKDNVDSYDIEDGDIEIDINSSMILNAVRAVIDYYPGWALWDGSFQSLSFNQLDILFQHRQSLLDYKAQHPPCHNAEYVAECNQHIDEVVPFLNQEYKKWVDIHDRWTQGEPTLYFNELWCLFKLGEPIFSRTNGELDPYVCTKWRKGPNDQFLLDGWNIDFDGSTFGRAKRTFEIKRFFGKIKIASLPVFPARFYDEKESESLFRKRRIESGKRFCKISRKPSYMEYTGVTRDVPNEKV